MNEFQPINEAPKDGTPCLLKWQDGTIARGLWAYSPNADKTAWCGIEPWGGAVLPYSDPEGIVEFKVLETVNK